nr:hypothetical protein [uncultured Celeribacter sp.]
MGKTPVKFLAVRGAYAKGDIAAFLPKKAEELRAIGAVRFLSEAEIGARRTKPEEPREDADVELLARLATMEKELLLMRQERDALSVKLAELEAGKQTASETAVESDTPAEGAKKQAGTPPKQGRAAT